MLSLPHFLIAHSYIFPELYFVSFIDYFLTSQVLLSNISYSMLCHFLISHMSCCFLKHLTCCFVWNVSCSVFYRLMVNFKQLTCAFLMSHVLSPCILTFYRHFSNILCVVFEHLTCCFLTSHVLPPNIAFVCSNISHVVLFS